MAATKTKTAKSAEDLREEIDKLDRRGYNQHAIAKAVGIGQSTVAYHLKRIMEDIKKRRLVDYNEGISRRVDDLNEIRREAWDAYERSKSDVESNEKEQAIKKVYEESVDENGKAKRVEVGQEMQLVKVIDKVSGRLPGCEYLQVIRAATMDIAKLQGLFDDRPINNNQINVLSWDSLHAKAIAPPELLTQESQAPAVNPGVEVVEYQENEVEDLIP